MNIIFSTQEGQWLQREPFNLTDENKILLQSTNEEDAEVRLTLLTQMRATTPANEADAQVAQSVYLSNKPTLKPTDVYQLIQVDATVDGTSSNGIINYRVNGEHVQIRF